MVDDGVGDIEGDDEFLAHQFGIEDPVYENNLPVYEENDEDWERQGLDPLSEEEIEQVQETPETTLITMEEMKQA